MKFYQYYENKIKIAYPPEQFLAASGLQVSKKCGLSSPTNTFGRRDTIHTICLLKFYKFTFNASIMKRWRSIPIKYSRNHRND